MIGAIVSMKLVANKSWYESILFWAMYIILATVIVMGVWYLIPGYRDINMMVGLGLVKVAILAVTFFAICYFWFKQKNLTLIAKWFVVAMVVDVAVSALIASFILSTGTGLEDVINNIPHMSITGGV